MPRFTRILISAALAVTVSGGLVATQADAVTKSTSVTVKAGPRLKASTGFKTEKLGAIAGPGGTLGFCIDYGKKSPNGSWGASPVSSIKDPTVRAEAQWLVNAYPHAIGTKTVEPAVKATLNRLVSADFRYDWDHSYVKQLKGTGVVGLSDQMLSDAKRYAGPVTVKTTLTKKPGKAGTGTILAAVTMNGRPAVGVPLKWTVTGAKTSGGAKTGKDGTVVLNLKRKGLAPVSWRVAVVTPDWRKANYSTPTMSSRQHLMRGGISVTSKASGSYTTAVVTQDCEPVCDGRPPVTIDAAAGKYATQWRAWTTKQIGGFTIQPGKSGRKTFRASDADHLLIQHREKVAGKWSKWRTAQTFDVVCPPWPKVEIDCACSGALTVTLTPTGSRYYTATVGSKTTDVLGPTTVSTRLRSGDATGITVAAFADAAHTKPLGSHTYGTWTQG